MKYLQLIALLLLPTVSIFGQVTGRITDKNGTPIAFANVVLHLAYDSSFVSGASTDDGGVFQINHSQSGSYYLQFSSIGYQTYTSPSFKLEDGNPRFQVQEIALSEENNALSEVVVSARKDLIQSTPTGKIVNIQASLMTKGSNALQILERLPGIILDRRYGQLSMNGQSGVTILFDGRRVQMSMEELMSLLESTVADNIDKIELITSPTAQYDADGGAGIINIIFKKSMEIGTRANFSTTAGYGFREKVVTSLGISRGFKKADIRIAYSFGREGTRNGFKGHGTSNNPLIGGRSMGIFENFTERLQRTHNANFTTEFRPGSKLSFGTDVNLAFANADNLSRIANIWDVKDVEYIRMKAISEGMGKRQNLIASAYIKSKLTEKSQLNFDISYIGYKNDSPNTINSDYFDEQGDDYTPNNQNFIAGNHSESLSKIKVGVLKADYSLAISDKWSVEIGGKVSYSSNENNSKVERLVNGNWELDPRSQSTINGDEKIGAGYALAKFKLNEKTNLQTGVRYEYWQRNISLYDKPFVIAKPFPSVLLTHQFKERMTVSLSYNRRISRPAYVDLISNLFYNDPTAVFTGNPLLKPTLTDAIKLDFTIKSLNIGLIAQQDINPILRYQLTANETNDLLVVLPKNMDYMRSLSLNINYHIDIFSWWRASFGSLSSLRKYKLSYSVIPAEKTYLFQNLNFNQTIQFPKNIELELSGWYNFPFYEGTNKLKGFGVLNLGVAKKLKNEWGTIQLALPDLLQTFRVRTHISGAAPIVFNIDTYSTWRDEGNLYRIVKLIYSRSFGNKGRNLNHNFETEERERVR